MAMSEVAKKCLVLLGMRLRGQITQEEMELGTKALQPGEQQQLLGIGAATEVRQ